MTALTVREFQAYGRGVHDGSFGFDKRPPPKGVDRARQYYNEGYVAGLKARPKVYKIMNKLLKPPIETKE